MTQVAECSQHRHSAKYDEKKAGMPAWNNTITHNGGVSL